MSAVQGSGLEGSASQGSATRAGLELLDCICSCTSMRYNTYCIEVLVLPPCHLHRMHDTWSIYGSTCMRQKQPISRSS